MSEIANFSVQILFVDDEAMDYEYENFTEGEMWKAMFKDAKEAGSGINIESVKVKILD